MSLSALLLVIVAAICHASWNLLAKRAAKVGPAFVFAYGLCSTILFAPWVIWILVFEQNDWNWAILGCILLSGTLHLAYSLSLQRGYQVADLSVVYPIARGTGPFLSTVGAILFYSGARNFTRARGHAERRHRSVDDRHTRSNSASAPTRSNGGSSLGFARWIINRGLYPG